MSDKISLKPSDTFLALCTYRDENGDLVDLDTAGIDITSFVKSEDGETRWELTYIQRDQTTNLGEYWLRSDETIDWSIGKLLWDIRFGVPHETGEISTSTETRIIYFGVSVS